MDDPRIEEDNGNSGSILSGVCCTVLGKKLSEWSFLFILFSVSVNSFFAFIFLVISCNNNFVITSILMFIWLDYEPIEVLSSKTLIYSFMLFSAYLKRKLDKSLSPNIPVDNQYLINK